MKKWSKILKVVNKIDGRNDTWLEGFGSLSNHFMLEKPLAGTRSETLWVLNGYYYITRELSADPIYGHDTGWQGTYDHVIEGLINTVTYEPDTLTTDHSIYNIQGQRLPAKPRHGIYIQDGRKKIAE